MRIGLSGFRAVQERHEGMSTSSWDPLRPLFTSCLRKAMLDQRLLQSVSLLVSRGFSSIFTYGRTSMPALVSKEFLACSLLMKSRHFESVEVFPLVYFPNYTVQESRKQLFLFAGHVQFDVNIPLDFVTTFLLLMTLRCRALIAAGKTRAACLTCLLCACCAADWMEATGILLTAPYPSSTDTATQRSHSIGSANLGSLTAGANCIWCQYWHTACNDAVAPGIMRLCQQVTV